ncbi:uncharacterized protein LOC129314121 [Prosopis cineraria]|uniref:uncharacterized protein LOC129314121 n=1 Tax=Prosopis cineraria TaxID=364024 RepID=UPI00240FBB35|nr:uncharacterized protein LOC129314121 [Prosopis cineraria]
MATNSAENVTPEGVPSGSAGGQYVPVAVVIPLPRPFPDISKIEVFDGRNFKCWQECVFTILDMHGVATALTQSEPPADTDQAQREACKIWESLVTKYTTEDAGKQKFVVGNYYKWEMTENKDVKEQINEYHKLLEELHAENINLLDEFVAGILIEKLPESWFDYKQQLKHKQKQLSLTDSITHIIIEDTNCKAIRVARIREMTSKANLVESKPHNKRTLAAQCRKRANRDKPRKPNKWVVDSGATRHICASQEMFTIYNPVKEGEDHVYLADFRTAKVQGKRKVVLKLTSRKTLALNDVLHVPEVRANLVSVALLGKAGTINTKSSRDSEFIAMDLAGTEAEWLKNFLVNVLSAKRLQINER